jgi:hypothetical protein
MKISEIATHIEIDPRKIVDYALNPKHPVGRHKARVFEAALGYTRDNWHNLLEQIQSLSLDSEAAVLSSDEFGRRVQVDLMITGVAGQRATVCTGWLITLNSDIARLVTLYVKEG